MRIGIDAACWANHRGYGRFTRELCRAMVAAAPETAFQFFLDERAAEVFDVEGSNVEPIIVGQKASPTEAASAEGNRSVRDMLRFTRAVRRARPDVFFSPTIYTYFPLPRKLPAVVTIHDAIAERLPHLTLPSRRARLFWAAKVKLAIWQARLVLTISRYSASELQEVLRIPPGRIRMAVPAPSRTFRPGSTPEEIRAVVERIGVPADAPWFVYCGGFNPHKNVDVVVQAHGQLAGEADPPPHLLLVGKTSGDAFFDETQRIRELVRGLGTESLVHWTGYLPDEDLRHAHGGAVALLLPSELEGLGLPALEAAACGSAVVATTRSPLPDLLEGGGYFIEPGDQAALLEPMRQLLVDPAQRREMGARGLARAAAITWPNAARATLEALSEAHAGTARS